MSGQHVTIAALVGEYALYGVTLGMIRSHAASIAVNNAAHLGGDHDPLPHHVAKELISALNEHAADYEAQVPQRQAAAAELTRLIGSYLP